VLKAIFNSLSREDKGNLIARPIPYACRPVRSTRAPRDLVGLFYSTLAKCQPSQPQTKKKVKANTLNLVKGRMRQTHTQRGESTDPQNNKKRLSDTTSLEMVRERLNVFFSRGLVKGDKKLNS